MVSQVGGASGLLGDWASWLTSENVGGWKLGRGFLGGSRGLYVPIGTLGQGGPGQGGTYSGLRDLGLGGPGWDGRAGDGLGDRVRWPLAVQRAARECVGVARPGRPSLLCTPRIAQSAVVFCSGCGMGSHLESHVQAEVSEWSQRSAFWSLFCVACTAADSAAT